jgi:PilZ domain
MNFSDLFAFEVVRVVLPSLILLATVLMVVLLVINKRRAMKPPKHKKQPGDLADTSSDRRNSLRRDGPPVEVTVQSAAFKGGSAGGYVLDRSTGGLKLALSAGLTAGSTLQVKAKHAPDTTPWVTVLVRSCRENTDHYELGCEFEKTPPWNVLLLFG